MIGIPTETRQEMMDTADFAVGLDPDYAQFSICTPYPKTELYLRMLQDGIVPHDYWQTFAEDPQEGFLVKFWNKDFTEEQLREIQAQVHQKFYRRLRYLAREALRVRSFADLGAKIKMGSSILLGKINE